MEDTSVKNPEREKWIIPAGIAGIIIISLFFFVLLRPKQMPEHVVVEYVNALAHGDCKKAYSKVLSLTKEYYSNYRTLQDFNLNVCQPTLRKYTNVKVFSVDEVSAGSDKTVVYFRLRFKISWMTRHSDRPMDFSLRRSGRHWYIEGPFLEI